MKSMPVSLNAGKAGFLISFMFFVLAMGACAPTRPALAPEEKFNAESHFPEEFQAAHAIPNCNQNVVWHSSMKAETQDMAAEIHALYAGLIPSLDDKAKEDLLKKSQKTLSKRLIRNLLIEGKSINLGAFRIKGYYWTDENGKKQPLVAYRSAITPWPKRPDSCYRSLLKNGNIKNIINLYDGTIPLKDHQTMEKEVAKEMGVNYVDTTDPQVNIAPFRELVEKEADFNNPENRRKASESVSRIINEFVLSSGGEAPKGNVYYHCAGGMHRTGIISGVIQRCVNGMDMETIKKSYARHVAYENDDIKGGFEELNLRFIQEFDCGQIKPNPMK